MNINESIEYYLHDCFLCILLKSLNIMLHLIYLTLK